MASRQRSSGKEPTPPHRRPGTTPQTRENQLISAATNLAERQLQDGTASAQVISHFLKLGSSRERLEQERLAMEVELMEAKKQQITSAEKMEAMYVVAIRAMRSYQGEESPLELDMEEELDDEFG